MQATDKQIGYIMFLARKQGLSTRYIDSTWKRAGLSMRERSGKVIDFLSGLDKLRASEIIERLKD